MYRYIKLTVLVHKTELTEKQQYRLKTNKTKQQKYHTAEKINECTNIELKSTFLED